MLASIVQKYISRKYIMAYDTYSSNYVVIVRRKGHFKRLASLRPF